MMAASSMPHLPEDWNRAMCIVAHPDDIEYGTASAVARWVSMGKEVTYVLASRGEAGIDSMTPDKVGRLREREQRDAAKAVGVDIVEFLDHSDGVIEYGQPLRRDLARMIRKYRPEVIVTQNTDLTRRGGVLNQADHRAVGLATLDAARDAGNRWVFPELLDEGLEPWPGVRYVCLAGAAEPNIGVDVTGFLDRGIASLQAHRVYMDGLGAAAFDSAEFLSWMAAGSGERMGVDAAVLFDLHTLIPEDTPPWATGSQA